MGLNMLIAVFSTMFNLFNVTLISFVFNDRLTRYL